MAMTALIPDAFGCDYFSNITVNGAISVHYLIISTLEILMLKHVAVRLRKFHHGQLAFELNNATVINANIEKRDPALKNLIEGLIDKGMEYTVDGCNLFWFQIDDNHPLEHYEPMNEVEVVFDSEWFENKKESFRHMSGMRYFDASAGLAEQFDLKDQHRKIAYQLDSVA